MGFVWDRKFEFSPNFKNLQWDCTLLVFKNCHFTGHVYFTDTWLANVVGGPTQFRYLRIVDRIAQIWPMYTKTFIFANQMNNFSALLITIDIDQLIIATFCAVFYEGICLFSMIDFHAHATTVRASGFEVEAKPFHEQVLEYGDGGGCEYDTDLHVGEILVRGMNDFR